MRTGKSGKTFDWFSHIWLHLHKDRWTVDTLKPTNPTIRAKGFSPLTFTTFISMAKWKSCFWGTAAVRGDSEDTSNAHIHYPLLFPFTQLQFLQHQMQHQQMGMAVGAAAQAALPRQHSANQPKSKRKRSTPQPLPKSWPPAGRQRTALCSIGSIYGLTVAWPD